MWSHHSHLLFLIIFVLFFFKYCTIQYSHALTNSFIFKFQRWQNIVFINFDPTYMTQFMALYEVKAWIFINRQQYKRIFFLIFLFFYLFVSGVHRSYFSSILNVSEKNTRNLNLEIFQRIYWTSRKEEST